MRTVTFVSNDVILIVDDSKFIAQAYSRVLLGLGYRVLIACDGKTGLFAAESCNPSIILLDMLMPDMDGVDVLRKVKQTPSTAIFQCWQLAACQKRMAKSSSKKGRQGTLKRVP
jgi:CheY-like chemotaxis protein